jgi:release factor glutamine methyltransferase
MDSSSSKDSEEAPRSCGHCGRCQREVPAKRWWNLSVRPRRRSSVWHIDDIVNRLRSAGSVFAEDEAALLVTQEPDARARERLIARRVAGEPLEIILGWVEFAGLRLEVAPGVFVPRVKTEFVARLAVENLPHGGTLADLCCGVGAIAAAVASKRPDAVVTAADISPTAVAVAARNLAPYGATVVEADIARGIPGRFNVITACPPYVPTDEIDFMPAEARDFEPHAALDGGADGTDLQAAVFTAAARMLLPGGVVVVETSERQAVRTTQRAVDAGLNPSVGRNERLGAVVVAARKGES